MRTIEKKIIKAIETNKACKLSSRDQIKKGSLRVLYCLHGIPLFAESPYPFSEKRAINLSSKGACDSLISATTKSRLNAFLEFYNMPKIRQKNFELFFDGEKLKVGNWYWLDCTNKKLIKMNSFDEFYDTVWNE